MAASDYIKLRHALTVILVEMQAAHDRDVWLSDARECNDPPKPLTYWIEQIALLLTPPPGESQ